MVITKNIDGKEVEVEITHKDVAKITANKVIEYISERIVINYGYDVEIAKELAEHAFWGHYYDKQYHLMYDCMKDVVDEYKEGVLTIKPPCKNVTLQLPEDYAFELYQTIVQSKMDEEKHSIEIKNARIEFLNAITRQLEPFAEKFLKENYQLENDLE